VTPVEVDAHVQFMRDLAGRLEETGEFVDIQAPAPNGAFVRYDGEGRPPVTDGPFVETKDLIAGCTSLMWSRGTVRFGRFRPTRPRSPSEQAAAAGPRISAVIGVLVRRRADFSAAENAVQDGLVEAVRVWPDDPPRASVADRSSHGSRSHSSRAGHLRHNLARGGPVETTEDPASRVDR
jgi:hypothetical protein